MLSRERRPGGRMSRRWHVLVNEPLRRKPAEERSTMATVVKRAVLATVLGKIAASIENVDRLSFVEPGSG